MGFKRLVIVLCVLLYGCGVAQVMNIRKWRHSEKDSLNKAIGLADEKKPLAALPLFEGLLANHPNEEFLKLSYAKCALATPAKYEEAYRQIGQVYAANKKIPDINFYMAKAAYCNDNFLEALNCITLFINSKRPAPELKKEAFILKDQVSYARYYSTHPTRAKVSNLGSIVNSEYEEYAPAITGDEAMLVFTYAGTKSKGGKQIGGNAISYADDIYLTIKGENEFKTPVPLDHLNTKASERVVGLSNDGEILFVFKEMAQDNGDLYESRLKDQFNKAVKLKGQVNTNAWEGHCSLSPDGHTLYFSSDRPGGLGGKDIYKASLSADSSWINITNLGDSINTSMDEDAPFIHADGRTLFYSSKGLASMGGYDVCRALMNPTDSTFKKAENLGYPINSTGDDLYFVMAANAVNAYYSSERKDGKGLRDIYLVEPNFKTEKPSLCMVRGKTKFQNKAVEALVKIEITSHKPRIYNSIYSNAKNGDYLVSLPTGESYKLTFSHKGYKTQAFEIDLTDISGYIEKNKNISFEVFADTLPLSSKTVSESNISKPSAPPGAIAVQQTAAMAGTPITSQHSEAKAATQASVTPTLPLTGKILVADYVHAPLPNALTVSATASLSESVGSAEIPNHEPAGIANTLVTTVQKEAASDAQPLKTFSSNTTDIKTGLIAENQPNETKASIVVPIRDTIIVGVSHQHSGTQLATVSPTMAPTKLQNDTVVITKTETQKPDEGNLFSKNEPNPPPSTDAHSTPEKAAPPVLPNTTSAGAYTVASIPAAEKPATVPVKMELGETKTVTLPSPKTPAPVKKDSFVPRNHMHQKTMQYIEKYGDVMLDGLEFRVQITAFKKSKPYDFPNLVKFGEIRELHLGDGYTRLEIGPVYKTMRDAFELNKKVVEAGQPEAYVVAIYKGKRYAFEELEFIEVFK